MARIYDSMKHHFETNDLAFIEKQDKDTILLPMGADKVRFDCVARAVEGQARFVFYSLCPIKAPEAKRHEVSEAITRANYGLLIGNFEMDYADGEIRYKSSMDVDPDVGLTDRMIKDTILANLSTHDRYFPALMDVIYGACTPTVAIDKVESQKEKVDEVFRRLVEGGEGSDGDSDEWEDD
ncbi:MAG: YbjN domain-containing protein [Armatimonadota bacterium]